MRVLNEKIVDAATVSASQTSAVLHLDHLCLADVTASITSANPSNLTFTAAASDVLTLASNSYVTGMKCTATTTVTLPAGLAVLTDYYYIRLSATTGKLATSQANALAGTAIDITDAGTGVHTLVPTTTLAGSVKLQKNNEPESADGIWFDITSSSQSFSGATTLNWALVDAGYRALRAVVTVTSGTITASVRANAKGA